MFVSVLAAILAAAAILGGLFLYVDYRRNQQRSEWQARNLDEQIAQRKQLNDRISSIFAKRPTPTPQPP